LNVGIPALLVDAAVFRAFVKKMLPPGAIFELKIGYTKMRMSVSISMCSDLELK